MEHMYIIFLLIVFIIGVSFYNEYNNVSHEGFSTSLKRIIRPHVRKTRLHIENFYSKHKNNFHSIVRKIGIK